MRYVRAIMSDGIHGGDLGSKSALDNRDRTKRVREMASPTMSPVRAPVYNVGSENRCSQAKAGKTRRHNNANTAERSSLIEIVKKEMPTISHKESQRGLQPAFTASFWREGYHVANPTQHRMPQHDRGTSCIKRRLVS